MWARSQLFHVKIVPLITRRFWGNRMNEAMKTMLIGNAEQKIVVSELSADLFAVMSVLCALGPEVREAFAKQRAIERDRIRGLIEEQRLMIQALQSGVSPLHN
jgi:hypothetical protein